MLHGKFQLHGACQGPRHKRQLRAAVLRGAVCQVLSSPFERCHRTPGASSGCRFQALPSFFFFFSQNKEFFQNKGHWLGNHELKCRLLLTDPVMLCLPDLSSCQLMLCFQISCLTLTRTATLLLAAPGGEFCSFSSSLREFFPSHVHSWRFPFGLWQKEGSGR